MTLYVKSVKALIVSVMQSDELVFHALRCAAFRLSGNRHAISPDGLNRTILGVHSALRVPFQPIVPLKSASERWRQCQASKLVLGTTHLGEKF